MADPRFPAEPGGGTSGGRFSTASAAPFLRPAAEAALTLARAGLAEVPPRPAPAALRPLLRFARLPTQAVTAVLRVLEADDDFRARVTESTSEADVGTGGWLFLQRPEGWEEELGVLVDVARSAQAAEVDERATEDARRRLADAEDESHRARLRAESAERARAAAEAALGEERRSRRARSEELEAARAALAREAEARRRATDRAADAETLVDALRARVAELESTAPPPPAPPWGAEVLLVLEEAATAASQLASRLTAAAALLAQELPAPAVGGGGLREEAPEPGAEQPQTEGSALPPSPRRSGGRSPAVLPPGVLEDSTEAAAHLVRHPRATVLVDGYNVSQRAWGDLSASEQRRRLVDALGELAARSGADVRVVFDGAADPMPAPPASVPRAVKVTFSPPGVEADDVIVGLVSSVSPSRPVVVASNDNRVREEAARAGANIISAGQLLAVAGRAEPQR